jgi:hypothetical protein
MIIVMLFQVRGLQERRLVPLEHSQVQACLEEYQRRVTGRADCVVPAVVPRVVLVAARAVHTQLMEWESRERAMGGAGPNTAVLKVRSLPAN